MSSAHQLTLTLHNIFHSRVLLSSLLFHLLLCHSLFSFLHVCTTFLEISRPLYASTRTYIFNDVDVVRLKNNKTTNTLKIRKEKRPKIITHKFKDSFSKKSQMLARKIYKKLSNAFIDLELDSTSLSTYAVAAVVQKS